jgi:hypothetical protein
MGGKIANHLGPLWIDILDQYCDMRAKSQNSAARRDGRCYVTETKSSEDIDTLYVL